MSNRVISKGMKWNDQIAKDVIAEAGEDFYLVYAWRWLDSEEVAKIGKSQVSKLRNTYWTMPKTFNVEDPVLIGYIRCASEQEAFGLERELLDETFNRIKPNKEWVAIDLDFMHVFCPDELT